jgi:hypothetical protein
MSKTIRLTYYGIEAEGPTVTAAKQAAGSKLEHLVAQTNESPTIVRVGAVVALVCFTRWGWGHRIFEGITEQPERGHLHPSGGFATRGEAEVYALRHVLDCAWQWPEDDAAWFDAVIADERGSTMAQTGVHLTPRELETMRGEFLTERKWQRDYKAAREQGYDDEDARYLIGGLTHLIKKHPAPAYNLDGDVDDRADHSGALPATDRPGDAAAVLHEETGIDYATCLVMTNTD